MCSAQEDKPHDNKFFTFELYNPNGISKEGIFDTLLSRDADALLLCETHASKFLQTRLEQRNKDTPHNYQRIHRPTKTH